MKKIVFIIALICMVIASSLPTNAQVDWSVDFDWDDSYCDCNSPYTVSAFDTIRTYPGGEFVADSEEWAVISTSPATVEGVATSLQDCQEDCYNIAVEIKVEDNTGQCCYGAENENVTGQELKEGYDFQTEIVLF
jgi:hypothetical protein